VFIRSGGVWSQQGGKLVGSGAVGGAQQGISVALSADGNTAIVGGNADNTNTGAAWVFVRSGGMWTQQGNKLVGTGAVGAAQQGISVALSADGNTAMLGGRNDNSNAGAAWVFTRSAGVWSQQGNKLVGTGGVGASRQGFSVALSGGGNTASVGGSFDNSQDGAAWVFTRSGGGWSQLGNKLVGTGAVGGAAQGVSVALSCNTAVVGGSLDNGDIGAAWVFVAPPTGTHEFNGDCLSDIVWRNTTTGQAAIWLMNGTAISSAAGIGTVTTDWSVVGQRDFNGDGLTDILWRHTSGTVAIWLMNGTTVLSGGSPGAVPTDWAVAGTGDFNGDGFGDILWRNTTSGQVAIWLMNGTTIASGAGVGTIPTTWVIAGTGDFDGDGMTDILWRDTPTGQAAIWLMNGTTIKSAAGIGTVPTDWIIAGTGDFNGDARSDILWRNGTSGQVAMWFMNGTTLSGGGSSGSVATVWTIVETGDFNGDGKSDLIWHDSSGNTAIWLMDGTTVLPTSASLGNVAISWTIQGMNAD
jgi:FG-GAP-like repeat